MTKFHRRAVLAAIATLAALATASPILAESAIPATPGLSAPDRAGYLPVNGLNMYYEVRGEGFPLILIHGAFSAIGTSFGPVIPGLAKDRQVIGLEMQAHGRTADIDRPLSIDQMAEDVAAAIDALGFEKADVFGYSMGSAIALQLAIRHPDKVRRLGLASIATKESGIQPGLMEGFGEMKAEMLHGTPWHQEYEAIAPNKAGFATLFAKKAEMDTHVVTFADADIKALPMPVLVVAGDADLVTPEHAVELLRLLGGGTFGDTPAGLPKSQLAILPGTSHVGMANRPDLLGPVLAAFFAPDA